MSEYVMLHHFDIELLDVALLNVKLFEVTNTKLFELFV